MATPHSTVPLISNWTFKQGGLDSKSDYLPANDLPTEVHRDLLKNEKIADPYLDLNELSVRWIADETWTYRTIFTAHANPRDSGVKTILNLEGLDTFASVYLNGKLVLESDNMFVEHRVDISDDLRKHASSEHVLEIVFESARQKGLELVKEHTEHKFIVHQTEVSRGPVRKAQYHWGWDWGPILLTCGPWKPITVETYLERIEDVWVEYELSQDLKTAKGKAFAKYEGTASKVVFELKRKSSKSNDYMAKLEGQVVNGVSQFFFDIPVDLWWPRGYGCPFLYTITATVPSQNVLYPVHQLTKTIGFRKVQLIQDSDSHGTSFYIRINNIDFFAGGSCWIPADSFVSQISPSRYYDWVKLAADGNQSMLRVWGGGIYEHSLFYEACDELGILVWQDFMFACANYPAYPSYLSSVELEARQNVRRLRNHPSIVIWAGNNEDYQIVERYGLEYRYEEDKDPQSWLKTDFPARYIYEYLLPKVIKEETKGLPYHPSSPFGNGTSTTLKVDPTVGDIHQWNVWHGTMSPYQQLASMGGRFVSEFGMEAYPAVETLEKSITKEEDRYPGSIAMDFRNKAIGHERRLISYVAENFQIKYDLAGYTHQTQVMQADALSWAYKSWRRQWGTKGNRKCGGVLAWQLNDCWPTISWAVVDYHLVPKLGYYAIRRAMEPVVVGVSRKVKEWTMRPADDLWKRDTSHVDMRAVWEDVEFDLWVASSKVEQIHGNIIVRFISIKSGEEILDQIKFECDIEPNSTRDIIKNRKVEIPNKQDPKSPFDTSKADPFIIVASIQVNDKEIARDISWPEPIKYLSFPDRGLKFYHTDDKTRIGVSAERPVKGFAFDEKQGVRFSDNGFDLTPGTEKIVHISGGNVEEFKCRYIWRFGS